MNRINRKLRSGKGASITFALLLFLVCAILCSVIIVAATAAAGRMSGMVETDQRYYSVTSAAQLLTDMFKNKTVVVARAVEKNPAGATVSDTTHIYMSDNGSEPLNYGGVKTTFADDKSKIEPGDSSGGVTLNVKSSFPTDAALRTVETSVLGSNLDNGMDGEYYASGIADGANGNRTFSMKVDGKNTLAVRIDETINPGGDIGTVNFTIQNAKLNNDGNLIVGDDNNLMAADNRYQLTLTLEADISERIDTSVSDEGNSIMTTYTTLTWKLKGIQ